MLPYIGAQVAGAIVAAAVLYAIASGKPDWVPGGFASNGYGDLSPGKYGMASCFLIEVIATFFFLYVIIGTTSKGAAVGFAGIPIGLCLTLIHLFLIPVKNASVNPAHSTGPALFAGGAYIGQLWLFPVANASVNPARITGPALFAGGAYISHSAGNLGARWQQLEGPAFNRLRIPTSGMTEDLPLRNQNPVPAVALRVDDTRRSLPCCVDGAGERTAREARLSHDVVFLGHAAERRVTQ